jgi:hypothetical protein
MLKPISKELIEFVKTDISPSIKCPKIKFSDVSKKMLSNIFEDIIEGEKEFENTDIQDKWVDFEKNKNIPKGFDYDYSPELARNEIERMPKYGCIYNFILNGRNIQVNIIMPRTEKISTNQCQEQIKRIFVWLFIATKYASKQCSRNLNIFIYLTNLKKTLPSHSKQINQEHANTGFTTTCSSVSEIHIFRDEEWFKVLIHETFHNLGLDFSGIENKTINQCIYNIFPMKTEEKYFETYCEMWAEIINVMFVTFVSSKNKKIENLIKKTLELLNIEREFSMFQCMKVLHFFGMTYRDLYEKTPTAVHARMYKYKESTPIFSYYILKSIMMFYVDEYIEWCAVHNHWSLNFDKGEKPNNLKEYCRFVREHYKNDAFLHNIDTIEKRVFTNNSTSKRVSNDIMQTLRMTVFEIQ